jgi:hypothetical protein
MPDDEPFYFGAELKEPEPSLEMARLLAVLGRFERHPEIMQSMSRHHQLWAIHQALYEQPEDTLTLLAQYYRDKVGDPHRYIPHVGEIEHLADRANKMWLRLAALGFNVARQEEPK